MKNARCFAGLMIVAAAVLASGCASSLAGSSYDRGQARSAMSVAFGTIESIESVNIEGTSGTVGAVGGGVLGGVLGSTVGRGKGSTIATAVGAAAGAGIGAVAEKGMTKQNGVEICVKMEADGRILAITQTYDPNDNFQVGERVKVQTDASGTSRVRPIR